MLGFAAAAFVSLVPVPNSSHTPVHDHQRCAYWYRQRYRVAPNNQVVAVFAPQPIGARQLAVSDAMASMDHWVTAYLDQRLRPERYAQ
ncbi:MAG TPA: hypothetical protein DF294_06635 [Psychrobacter sp.]|nr:hypothetical protein [Psychrobacter sp.]